MISRPTEQGGAPASPEEPRPRRRRTRTRAAFLVLALLAVIAVAATVLPTDWQATQRREAYLPQLEAQARRSPGDGPLLALLGGRRMEAGDYAGAADALRRAAADGATDQTVWQALAACNAAMGNSGAARADLQLGIKTLPDAPKLQTALTQDAALGPTATPEALARAISPDGPRSLLNVYAAGSLLNGVYAGWARRHPDQSGFATRERWARERPDDAQALRLWAEALRENRRGPEAEAVLQRALALAPNSPATHLAYADLLRQTGRLQPAAQEYLTCLRLRRDWPPALLGLGQTLMGSGLVNYALTAYQRASESAPGSADAWIGLGAAQRQTDGDSSQAVASYATAARLAPARTDYLDDYATALRQNNQRDQAEAVIRRRLAVAPEDAFAHYLLGRLLMETDPTPPREQEAEAETRTALQRAPGNAAAEAQLGQLLLEQGQAREAVGLLTDSLRRRPFDRSNVLLLAQAYRRAGQAALSEQAAQQASQLLQEQERVKILQGQERTHGTDTALRQQLADLYDRTGLPAKAAEERRAIHDLQTAPREALQNSHALEDSLNAALSPH